MSNRIPALATDLNKLVKLNVILNNHDTFQTMHIEVARDFAYTIIARISEGEIHNEGLYKIKKIDFKFIDIDGIGAGLCIHDVRYVKETISTSVIHKFELIINQFSSEMGDQSLSEHERSKNYTFTLEKELIVSRENILDIHMNESFYTLIGHSLLIKGRQCVSGIYY